MWNMRLVVVVVAGSREDTSDDDDDEFTAFVSAMPSKGTKKEYLIQLRYFFSPYLF
jgi:hypothetical protein